MEYCCLRCCLLVVKGATFCVVFGIGLLWVLLLGFVVRLLDCGIYSGD